MNGILVVDKPKGLTSRDVVNELSRKFQTKKVGHTGTLDPLATGVLVLCFGTYTKFVSKFVNHDKKYIATIRFGIETNTLDITGEVLKEDGVIPSKKELELALQSMLGEQMQEVPLYSAKKIQGKKLYEYAREGMEVTLPKQNITIFSLELIHFEGNLATISCHVSKGTYIRSLIRDIGKKCSSLATMSDLRRTSLGDFSLSNAFSLEEILHDKYEILSFHDLLSYETYSLLPREYDFVLHGNELNLPFVCDYVLLTYEGKEISLYQKKQKKYIPFLQHFE